MKDLLTFILNTKNYSTYNKKFTKCVASIYKIQQDALMRFKTFSGFDGAILGISDDDFFVDKNLNKILQDIVYEHKKYNFSGIFLDFQGDEHSEFVYLLDELCLKEHIVLYVPFSYAKVVQSAKIVMNTAISGGNLEQIFEYSILQYGLDRICAEISLDSYEFDIPSKNEPPRKIVHTTNTDSATVFFSENLCTNYFTKMANPNRCIFTIFEDEKSFKYKVKIFQKLNVNDIFINCEFIEKYDFLQ